MLFNPSCTPPLRLAASACTLLDFIDQNRAAQPDADAEMQLQSPAETSHANLAKLRGLNRRALLDTPFETANPKPVS